MAEVKFNIPSFNGVKTYLFAAAGIGVVAAHALGYVPDPIANTLYGLLGFGGLAAARAGITKSGPEAVVDEVSKLVIEAINLQPPCKDETPNPTPTAVG